MTTSTSKFLRSVLAAFALLVGVGGTAQVFLANPAYARHDSRDLRDHREKGEKKGTVDTERRDLPDARDR
jgi:hypothetical protein